MNSTRYIRLAAFLSLVLLLVVSVTPLLAQPLVEFVFVTRQPPPPNSPTIHGAGVISSHGDASGRFIIREHSPDSVRPSRILFLTPQEGSLICTGEVPQFVIRGIAHRVGVGKDRLLGEYTMTVTPISPATRTRRQLLDVSVEIRVEDRVIQVENTRILAAPPNPC
jgi:hypothetical protein